MARSDYIYAVFDGAHELKAAFTVKHEMIFWLRKHKFQYFPYILRLKDNGGMDGATVLSHDDKFKREYPDICGQCGNPPYYEAEK